jgi:DivIVA domain-containing protein
MKKKDATTDGGSDWSSPVGGRVNPMDVQQKEFRVTRVGAGYRMREVDEFLDQVTDTLSALIAENERLRTAPGAVPPAKTTPERPPSTMSTTADRGAVDAFLQREKGFLQDLGELVQAHAEELRSMIRAARNEAAPTAERAEEPAAVAEPVPVAEPEPEPLADDAPSTPEEEIAPTSDAVEETDEPSSPTGGDGESRDTSTITSVVADEPIHLEEPEPARSGRPEEKENDSLRELFWGEE